MAWSYTTQLNRVHYLLNQDPSDSNNYVSSTMIGTFMQEGLTIACLHGKILEQTATHTFTAASATYASILTSGALTSTAVIEVFDVQISNVSLEKILPQESGKVFQTGTANDPMWWYMFGESVYLLPAPSGAGVSATCFMYGLDLTDVTSGTPQIPEKHYDQLTNFAAFRGKQVYNAHQEANTFLGAFAQAINVDLAVLKQKLGVIA